MPWCVCLHDCVCSVFLCGLVRQAIGPFLQNVPHSWRQLPTANSIPGGFLRPDKLNLTVIRLISPFSCRCCLPGRAAADSPTSVYSCPRQKAFHRLSARHSDLALRDAARVEPVMRGCKFRCGVQSLIKNLNSCQTSEEWLTFSSCFFSVQTFSIVAFAISKHCTKTGSTREEHDALHWFFLSFFFDSLKTDSDLTAMVVRF